eukprot:gnl/Trimastix_PCT/377.p1 GENE.gnl/Trimastix_PCT/377~~gnl/Trimastix_PCT/377.p1  ORF type:complete len:543 (+),score=209.59 gnl/Trimastix_PCT/377:201-1631(+)
MANPNDVKVTNDGATILKSIAIDNAAAKILVNCSTSQDSEVGDGTTSVCVLSGELLREAEKLVNQRIHPQTIISGYRMAAECALNTLRESAIDNSANPEQYRSDLMNIARTVLSSKILCHYKDHFAAMAVDAVLRLQGSQNLEHIHIIKKTGASLGDSFLDEGYILAKSVGIGQPTRLENPKILVANTAMDADKIKIYGTTVKVSSSSRLADIEREEKQKMREKCQKIVDTQCDCFINRLLIYNFPEQFFADHGVMAIEHAEFTGIEGLALVLGADIVSQFDDTSNVRFGTCRLIEEIMIGEDKMIHFSGVPVGAASTIVLRGANQQILDEAERSLHDALCVLAQAVNRRGVILGGGCSEVLMARHVDELAQRTPGKKQLAIEGFARALRQIPTILADNAGYDSAELVAQLRAAHSRDDRRAGLNMTVGQVGNMYELGILEPLHVKEQVVSAASEAAEMILRIDDIITCAPRAAEE